MENMGKKIIYGVDTSQKVTPTMVRDAIIKCFVAAHKEVLDESKEFVEMGEKEFEETENDDVKERIYGMIRSCGGDPENPTKSDLLCVVSGLKKFAQNFRNPGIVEKHAEEIMTLMELI